MVVGLLCALIVFLKWEDLWVPVVFAEVVFCLSSTVCLSYWGLGCFVHQDPDVIVSPWHILRGCSCFFTSAPVLCLKDVWGLRYEPLAYLRGCSCF